MKDTCRCADLRYKEVINTYTGERLGYASDVEIDMEDAKIKAIIISGELRLFGLLGKKEDIVIPWESIDHIGEDIILVNAKIERKEDGRSKHGPRKK